MSPGVKPGAPERKPGRARSRSFHASPASAVTARPDRGETPGKPGPVAGNRAALQVEAEAELRQQRHLVADIGRRPGLARERLQQGRETEERGGVRLALRQAQFRHRAGALERRQPRRVVQPERGMGCLDLA